MNRKSRLRLNVQKVLADFQKVEESSSHRKGTFKITAPFEEALETILRVKPNPQRNQRRRKKASEG